MIVLAALLPHSHPAFGLDPPDIHRLSSDGHETYERMENVLLRMLLFPLILLVASLIGLWFYWKPAKSIFMISYAFIICASNSPFTYTGNSKWTVLFDSVELLIVTAIIVIMFRSPVRGYFSGKEKAAYPASRPDSP